MIKKIITFVLSIAFLSQYVLGEEANNLQLDLSKKYIHSKLEENFPNETLVFTIQNDQIILTTYPDDKIVCASIRLYLEEIVGCSKVEFDSEWKPEECELVVSPSIENEPIIAGSVVVEEGGFLPELNPFFPTLLAQPHIVGYSAGYRGYDKTFRTACIPVSIGDQFSLYQFKSIPVGRLYLGIEACVWAIFEAKAKSLALINADYYVALPITYIYDKFAVRLRAFHESSHLGDEILLEHTNIKRLNPSMEVVDLFVSYNFMESLTVFGGASRVLRSDESFKIKPNGFYYGFNYYLNILKLQIGNLEATPYIASYFNTLQQNHWSTNCAVAVGYQWDKLYGHKLRIYVEGYKGYSQEGQFSKQKTQYVALKLLYGY